NHNTKFVLIKSNLGGIPAGIITATVRNCSRGLKLDS
ncbi:MAG: hypothetical protein ACI9G1_003950, partial [Pirellulaceae bacterium]